MTTTILEITSSARGAESKSTLLANELVQRLRERHPGALVRTRDVAQRPVRMLDGEALRALGTPPNERSSEQLALVRGFDELVDELKGAEIVVFAVPMYNFAMPIQLKAYFDAVARNGATFRYTASGPEGLLKGKKVYVVFGRGGLYRGTPLDVQTPHLQTLLSFLGMTDVEYIFAEGLDMGPEAQQAGLGSARRAIAELTVGN